MEKYKTCSLCSTDWKSLETMLTDSSMEFCGYQAYPPKPEKGLLLFTHKTSDCGTTFSLRITDFTKFSEKVIEFNQFEMGKEPDCEGHCLDKNNLKMCHSKKCEGQKLRSLLQVVKEKMNENEAA